MKKIIIAVSLLVSGCTSVTVTPLDASYKVKHICIRENPKVTVHDFVPVVVDGLRRHGISSEFIATKLDKDNLPSDTGDSDRYYMEITPAPDNCDFNLTYTARRSWDLGTFLSSADISISDKKSVIAMANYHLRLKGGYSLFKWQGVKTKIDPVMDELLKFYNTMGNTKADLNGTASKVLLNDRANANQKGKVASEDTLGPNPIIEQYKATVAAHKIKYKPIHDYVVTTCRSQDDKAYIGCLNGLKKRR